MEEKIELPENIPPVFWGIVLLYTILFVIGIGWCWLGGHDMKLTLSAEELGLAVAIGLAIVVSALAAQRFTRLFVRLEEAVRERLGGVSTLEIIGISLASSIAEEVFFRGAMQPSLAALFDSPIAGWILTSAIFGLVHTGPNRFYLPWTVFASACGLILGWLAMTSGGILQPIVVHFIVNAVNLRNILNSESA